MASSIGVDVSIPAESCEDRNCPFHGSLRVRGQILEGEVASGKMSGTVIVQRERLQRIKKYERYEKRTSRIAAHNPPCIGASEGDWVKIMECRPISKTKKFVVIEKREK